MTVELIYDSGCPNVFQARANLMKAISASGREASWIEWDRTAPASPHHVRGYGSPTILVHGTDVTGELSNEAGSCCRLYREGGGRFEGAPSIAQISAAFVSHPAIGSPWTGAVAALPGIGLAFVPKLACPACWPVYGALLGSVGMGFLLDASYLLPLTVAFLTVAVGALAFRAQSRWGYGPFAAGLAASAVILLGKFVFGSDLVVYSGVALLVAASVWNALPARTKAAGCPACVSNSSVTASPQEEIST
jgi:mercuric ion transport protein